MIWLIDYSSHIYCEIMKPEGIFFLIYTKYNFKNEFKLLNSVLNSNLISYNTSI